MGVFSGLTFCVSGAFSLGTQKEMEALLVKNGGKASTWNKSVKYLVCEQMGSGKTQKAEEGGIPVVTEAWVQESISKGKLSTNSSHFLSGGGSGGGDDGDDAGSDDEGAAAAASSPKKGKKRKAESEEDEEEEEEEEEKPKKKKAAPKKAASKKSKKKAESEEDEDEEEDEEEEEKPKKKKAKTSGGGGGSVFAGHTFSVSGAFGISQGDMKKLIIKNGGKVAPSCNKSCSYLVCAEIGSGKTQKAQKDGIPIVGEEWVNASIYAGKIQTDKKFILG